MGLFGKIVTLHGYWATVLIHFLLANAVTWYFLYPYWNVTWWLPLVGLLAILVGQTIDHASTIPMLELFRTKEFQNSWMKKYYYEGNIVLGKHPSKRRYLISTIILGTVALAGGFYFPPWAIAYAYITIWINRWNTYLTNEVRDNLDILRERRRYEMYMESLDCSQCAHQPGERCSIHARPE